MIYITNRRIFSILGSKSFLAIPAICLLLLSACATTSSPERAQAQLESLTKEADAQLSNGQKDKAVALLNQAAKEQPTSMVPWLKMANIWFSDGNYPATIQAANEALQRDPANQEAKSLLVVSGLRVAANAVSGLRSSNTVNSNVRGEAESLTNSLRTVLGEKVLVPAPANENRSTSHSVPRKVKPNAAVRTAAQSNDGAGATDPFKSLK